MTIATMREAVVVASGGNLSFSGELFRALTEPSGSKIERFVRSLPGFKRETECFHPALGWITVGDLADMVRHALNKTPNAPTE